MKKLTLLLLVVFAMSCKGDTKEFIQLEKVNLQNEFNEKYLMIEITLELINKLDQQKFTSQCLPIINRVYKLDSTKYKMVHIIGTKLAKESNTEAYNLGYENLIKEFDKLE